MRRTISGIALLLTVTALTAGCHTGLGTPSPEMEYHFEVTGTSAQKISYSVTQEKGRVTTEDADTTTLPWKQQGIAYAGQIRLDVMPTGGPVTCKIIVEKKQVAKKTGPAGTPLSCVATLKKPS
jgi:hypothetical protein